ncbi:hypothetical protein CC80DRAFT_70840 [Byssothecium circinans]|uniref:C2H2-type domain-containing protein n=1 Tax=Byssothecium circinans TaxID=147558 RepID=A0A6A5TU59_9PLEO|nr:hypothetical protein CC80DRAFT_70840 [Byssothecium circinans]
MFSPPTALAGKKRGADLQDTLPTAAGLGSSKEYRVCEDAGCFINKASDVRPKKRHASAVDVSAFHNPTDDHANPNLEVDQQFPDICFEEFCQDCNEETSCNSPPCSLPCPEAQCDQEACWDPHCQNTCDDAHCDQQYCVQRGHCDQQPCLDECIDPECTKKSGMNEPCFCPKCHVEPCPLGEPNNECHLAHSGPTAAGTIYCYDNAPCHFQEGLHGFNPTLSSYESYPCYSQSHRTWDHRNDTTQASSAATPSLSYHTSLESTFSTQPSSAPTQKYDPTTCFLNIPAEHCHIDNSCCHGDSRACGDDPTAPTEYVDIFNKSIAQGSALANNLTNFGFGMDYPSLVSPANSTGPNHRLDESMVGVDDSWMIQNPPPYNAFQSTVMEPSTKLDLLASAVQNDLLQTELPSSISGLHTTRSIGLSTDEQSCICKWQHNPGVLCLARFDNAEALHKHIKVAHVDNCNRSFCQWEGCETANKDFKQRSKLSRHLLGHAGHRPYACNFDGCDKTFATNQAKANHERTHTGDRPYECKQCGYTTTTYTQLQTHISALHEGKKPHKCRFCDFSCADSSNLSKHERTHQTLRPYRCIHPGCTFKPDCRWENLKRHLRRSGHCPELLIEGSEENKTYRETVRREIDDYNKRSGEGAPSKVARRKSRG